MNGKTLKLSPQDGRFKCARGLYQSKSSLFLATYVSEEHYGFVDFFSDRTMAAFVSQLSLDDYHGAEEVFTNELTKYTKKQFFEVRCDIIVPH